MPRARAALAGVGGGLAGCCREEGVEGAEIAVGVFAAWACEWDGLVR